MIIKSSEERVSSRVPVPILELLQTKKKAQICCFNSSEKRKHFSFLFIKIIYTVIIIAENLEIQETVKKRKIYCNSMFQSFTTM